MPNLSVITSGINKNLNIMKLKYYGFMWMIEGFIVELREDQSPSLRPQEGAESVGGK